VAIQRTLEDRRRDKCGEEGGPLGVKPAETQAALQQDVFKELINKLAWVLGSTYRTRYSTPRCPTRRAAVDLARRVLKSEGYPRSIKKTEA